MSKAYDIAASSYDTGFTHTKIGAAQRNKVYRNLDFLNNFEKKIDILELNCGTGEDAIAFAKKGHRVFATDISKKMIEVANAKNHLKALNFQVLDSRFLQENVIDKQFDVIFSNFGGLNCINPTELEKLFQSATKLLKPNGRLIMVFMPKHCIWEQLYFFIKGDFQKSSRRNTKEELLVHVEGLHVPTWYYNPKNIKDCMETSYEVTKLVPVGIAIPPSYLEHSVLTKFPIWPVLKHFENILSYGFLAKYADHFLIELTKK